MCEWIASAWACEGVVRCHVRANDGVLGRDGAGEVTCKRAQS